MDPKENKPTKKGAPMPSNLSELPTFQFLPPSKATIAKNKKEDSKKS